MSETDTLSCPKCGANMRSYERNGVVVEQCTECRGLFLDRGELERLVDAESRFYDSEGDRGERKDRDRDERPRKSKKRSFLENLLEGGE
jgi:Zn-finger nucleic acid-binding protein